MCSVWARLVRHSQQAGILSWALSQCWANDRNMDEKLVGCGLSGFVLLLQSLVFWQVPGHPGPVAVGKHCSFQRGGYSAGNIRPATKRPLKIQENSECLKQYWKYFLPVNPNTASFWRKKEMCLSSNSKHKVVLLEPAKSKSWAWAPVEVGCVHGVLCCMNSKLRFGQRCSKETACI